MKNQASELVQQIYDGVGFTLRSRQRWKLICCDCGLTHEVVMVTRRNGWIGMAMRRLKTRPTPEGTNT